MQPEIGVHTVLHTVVPPVPLMGGVVRWLSVRVEDYPAWLASLWAEGARRLTVEPVGPSSPSASLGVVGGVVHRDGERCWLRVAPFDEGRADVEAWTGTLDAAAIRGVAKPELLGRVEWTATHPVPVPVSAELLTLVEDPVVQPGEQFLTHDPPLPPTWCSALRGSLDSLAAYPSERRLWWWGRERLTAAVHALWGDRLPTDVAPEVWRTEHLDLHWGQVTAPTFTILDWEHWGVCVAGWGAARLYCTALAAPTAATDVYKVCRDVLEAPSGRWALLANTADLLTALATYRDDAGVAPRLRQVARAVLAGQAPSGRAIARP